MVKVDSTVLLLWNFKKKPNLPILHVPESSQVDFFGKNPRSMTQYPSGTEGDGPWPSKGQTQSQQSNTALNTAGYTRPPAMTVGQPTQRFNYFFAAGVGDGLVTEKFTLPILCFTLFCLCTYHHVNKVLVFFLIRQPPFWIIVWASFLLFVSTFPEGAAPQQTFSAIWSTRHFSAFVLSRQHLLLCVSGNRVLQQDLQQETSADVSGKTGTFCRLFFHT